MSLTDAEMLIVRTWVGTTDTISDVDVQALAATIGDDPLAVSWHILGVRLADLLAGPTSWSAEGDYTENVGDQVKGLQRQIDRLAAAIVAAAAADDVTAESDSDQVGRLYRTDRARLFGR